MKRMIVTLMTISTLLSISIPALAFNKENMKKDNFTGWWYDKDTQHNYYFKNGDTIIGWFNEAGKKYYTNSNGELLTGWQEIEYKWYYFNKSGAMQTGWLEGANNKYYYLNTDGSMLVNTTTPDGYKVGSDGAWIN